MAAEPTQAPIPDELRRTLDPHLVEILDAFHEAESTARTLRDLTLTTSTAGAVKAVGREPSPELVELRDRYQAAALRLQQLTSAATVAQARQTARDLVRQAKWGRREDFGS